MAAVSLLWNTNMAAVTSCENALYIGVLVVYVPSLVWVVRVRIRVRDEFIHILKR